MHSAYRLGWYPKWVRCMGHPLEGDLGRQKHCGRCILGLGPGVRQSNSFGFWFLMRERGFCLLRTRVFCICNRARPPKVQNPPRARATIAAAFGRDS